MKGKNAHMGLGDIVDNSSKLAQDNNRNNRAMENEKNAEVENLFETIEMLNQLLKDEAQPYNHSKIVEIWEIFSYKLESFEHIFAKVPRQLKNNAYYEVKKLTIKLLKAKECELARLSLRWEYKLISKLYSGRQQLKKLLELGKTMQSVAKKMVLLEVGGQFIKEQKFMDDILQDMQRISEKEVGMKTKFILIAGFCIAYGGSCIETNHDNLAKEITQKAIFLIETVYHDYKCYSFDVVLASCYQNFGVALHRLGDNDSANNAFAKRGRFEEKAIIRRESNIALGKSTVDSAVELVLSITTF